MTDPLNPPSKAPLIVERPDGRGGTTQQNNSIWVDWFASLRKCIIDNSAGGVGDGNVSGLGIWRYQTATGATPAAGQLQFNNTTIDSATNLYVNVTNDVSTDMSAFLGLLASGDLIYIQVQPEITQFVVCEIGTPSLSAGVYTFPLTKVEAQGTAIVNNSRTAVIATLGGSGGASDHGALTGLADDDHTQYLHKDTTRNVTVGYTTDVHAVGTVSSGTHTPTLTLERTKTMTVGGSFTLGKPTTTGQAHYHVSVSGTPPAGGWTITEGTGVVLLNGVNKVESGKVYSLDVECWGASVDCMTQLIEIKNT